MEKDRLVLIDGNSILNRAFYGIMGSKMLVTKDGTYTNAVYGFLAILFKALEDINPKYLAVAFDLKAPTQRHKLYSEYKANRKGMPDELAQQMPIIKEVLKAMNIQIIEKEGYEGDDILGTFAKYGEKEGLDVTILSGDRDNFQLASDNITIRIPRTKMGKTEIDNFDKQKVIETYGILPEQLIEVKGLMGDSSDNIPGVPGIGEKTALKLISEYETIEKIYEALENGTSTLKGKQKEVIEQNKDLAMLSKTLGTININVPTDYSISDLEMKEWDKEAVYKLFKELNFNRYIDRFDLKETGLSSTQEKGEQLFNIIEVQDNITELMSKIKENKKIIFHLGLKSTDSNELIIKKEIDNISICIENDIYYMPASKEILINYFKDVFEDENIEKYGMNLKTSYILLKQIGINMSNLKYDVSIAAYLLDSTNTKYDINNISFKYLDLDINEYLEKNGVQESENKQLNLFDVNCEDNGAQYKKIESTLYAYCIKRLISATEQKLKEINSFDLFNNIEMPAALVLADMQWQGMYIDKDELEDFGKEIKEKCDILTTEIYELAEQEFNINSPKQLGEILFDKLKLTSSKKNKNGYSTDVDTLEKIKGEHPIVEKILEYRQVMKLFSTYVEGLKPYINPETHKIHSFFHQTVTATGRISSTEPNLQNIPTRMELGKRLRKVFKPLDGNVYIDADYSQIELRVLAAISEDEKMVSAFNNGEDIHTQVASQVFGVPIYEVTKEQRSNAKAVNFGIVYGISDFGLSEQLLIPRKKAKAYIEQYLEKYSGIKNFMHNITEEGKEKGYVETIFHRRRYIPELSSNNYMVRQFGARAAMNTPIQGTAADIMKIAMIDVYYKLKEKNLKSKLILQVHDELIIESPVEEKDEVKDILRTCMENASKLIVPLKVELSEADNWYDCK